MNNIIVFCAILGGVLGAPRGGYGNYGSAPAAPPAPVPVPSYGSHQAAPPAPVPVSGYPSYGSQSSYAPAPTGPIITGTLHQTQDTYGQYNYGYSSSDGQDKTEQRGNDGSVNGQFSYTSPEGSQVALSYQADKGGFRPVGTHLPKEVEMPAELAQAYQDSIQRLQQAYEEARQRGDTEFSDDGSYKQEHEAPAYQHEEQSNGYSAPAAPAYQHRAPAAPAYHAPAAPAYHAPAAPAYPAPAAPAYHAPAQPAYHAPAQPAYHAPAQPTYHAPAAPATYVKKAIVAAPSSHHAYPSHGGYSKPQAAPKAPEPVPYLSSSYSTEIGGVAVQAPIAHSYEAPAAPQYHAPAAPAPAPQYHAPAEEANSGY